MNERLIGTIEAGGTKFVVAVAREDGTVLAETRIPTRTPAECFPDVERFFKQASAAHGPISAFGVASFGPIDIDPASPAPTARTGASGPGLAYRRFEPMLLKNSGGPSGQGETREVVPIQRAGLPITNGSSVFGRRIFQPKAAIRRQGARGAKCQMRAQSSTRPPLTRIGQ